MGFVPSARSAVAAAVAATLVAVSAVPAGATSPAEMGGKEGERLRAGELVVAEQTVDNDAGRWVGGTSRILVDAPPEAVVRTLFDVGAYPQILPATRAAKLVALSRDGDLIVELVQGNRWIQGKYTARVRRVRDDFVEVSLDARYDHDIKDARAWFHVAPVEGGRTQLTLGVLVDTGPGIVRMLFEERIRRLALSTPRHVRSWVVARQSRASLGPAQPRPAQP